MGARYVVVVAFAGLPLGVRSVPLLDGLTYEYAVLVALLVFAVGVMVGSDAARSLFQPYTVRYRALAATPWERLWPRLRGWTAGLFAAIVAAALLPCWWGGRSGCVWERGLAVYGFVTVGAALLGLAMGVAARARAPASRRRRALWIALAVAVVVGLTLYEVLAGPRAVFHNLVLGIVSNTAYLGLDEGVRIAGHDVLHRLATVVLASALVAWAVEGAARTVAAGLPGTTDGPALARLLAIHGARARRWRVALLSVLGCMLLIGDPFGFGSGRRRLEARLAGRTATAHLELRYELGSTAAALAPALAADCEWDYQRMAAAWNLDPLPADAPRIAVWIYADDQQQLVLTGATGYLFAKPWLGQLHTRLGADGELSAFAHELVHVLAARFGLPVLRVSARYGLIEGVAEALAGGYAERPWRHEPVAAALALDLLPPAASLVSNLGFASLDASTSYAATASLCGFLLQRYGAESLQRVYAWGDFETAYGRDLASLDREWREFLATIPVGERALAVAARRFDREQSPPFFRRLCARLGRRTVATASDERELETRLSDLDRRAAVGPQLERDAALSALAVELTRQDRLAEAWQTIARRAELQVAPGVVGAAERAGADAPSSGVRDALLFLLTGYPEPRAEDLDAPLVRLVYERQRLRGLDAQLEAARRLGGCVVGFESYEARLLLAIARSLRRDGREADARELLENGLSIVGASPDVALDLALELERADGRS